MICKANCQHDGVAQLQCIQQVEESMGGWVSGDKALEHHPRAELFETALRWTPALGKGGCRLFCKICISKM